MSESIVKLADLETELLSANEALAEAVRCTSRARNEETTARNRVNDLQKKIDAHITALRSKAQDGTEWQSVRAQKVGA